MQATKLDNSIEISQENEGITKPPQKKNKGKTIFVVVMLAFPLLHLFVFWFLVNVNTIVLSFQEFDWFTGENVFVWFDNYKEVFRKIRTDDITQRIILNSFLYLPVTNFISLPLCFFLSYFLYKKVWCSNIFRVVYFLPSIIPVAVLAMAFSFTFDAQLGPINTILKAIGIKPPSWFGVYPNNQIMIFVYCIWSGLGVNTLLLSSAIGRIPEEIMEYNKIEGVSKPRELFGIIMPLIWPTITTTFILGCSSIFIVMMQPLMLTPGSNDTLTISLYIYNGVMRNKNLPYLSAFGLTLSAIGVPLIMLIKWGLGKIYADVEY